MKNEKKAKRWSWSQRHDFQVIDKLTRILPTRDTWMAKSESIGLSLAALFYLPTESVSQYEIIRTLLCTVM